MLLLSSCFQSTEWSAPHTFEDGSISIKLTEDFVKVEVGGYTVAYSSEHLCVYMLYEASCELDCYDLREYTAHVIVNNDFSAKVKLVGDKYTFSFDSSDETGEYGNVAYTVQTGGGFWLIHFAYRKADEKLVSSKIKSFADTIKVK